MEEHEKRPVGGKRLAPESRGGFWNNWGYLIVTVAVIVVLFKVIFQLSWVPSGSVQITRDLQRDISGRDIIVVEDILDSGNTLAFLKDYMLAKGAKSITIVTLLDKPARREKAITADLSGFVVPDEFVVGYGLDYCQQYRNMPYIGVLKPEVYSK